MPRSFWLLSGLLLVALADGAHAQTDPHTFFGGVHPRDMVYKPVDTSNLVTPLPRSGSTISLSGILSKFHIPGLHTGGSTPPGLPVAGAIPTSPYKNAFQPVAPIYPK